MMSSAWHSDHSLAHNPPVSGSRPSNSPSTGHGAMVNPRSSRPCVIQRVLSKYCASQMPFIENSLPSCAKLCTVFDPIWNSRMLVLRLMIDTQWYCSSPHWVRLKTRNFDSLEFLLLGNAIGSCFRHFILYVLKEEWSLYNNSSLLMLTYSHRPCIQSGNWQKSCCLCHELGSLGYKCNTSLRFWLERFAWFVWL